MSKNPPVFRRDERDANGAGKALQTGRRVTAVVALSVMVVFFVMLGTSAALRLKWIADVQLMPVVLSVSGSLILFWALVTLLFGRVYCSMVCPTGILQDVAARVPRRSRRLKFRRGFRYHTAHNKFRYMWLAVTVLSAIAGMSMLMALLDPYGTFGRFMTYLLRPLIAVAKGETVVAGTIAGIAVAAVTLIAVVAVATKRGRLICNTVCPVGSALSLLSRHSVYGMDINTDACVNCGLCERVCKAECIDSKGHTVDMSRCVVCFNCTAVCDSGAITYTRRRHRLSIPMLMKVPGPRAAATFDGLSTDVKTDMQADAPGCIPTSEDFTINDNDGAAQTVRGIDRRRFLASGLILAAAPVVLNAEKKLRRVMPKEIEQQPTGDVRPVPPPGIVSTRSFLAKCVGCGACISACPADVLRPSTTEYGAGNPLHPLKNYDDSYCRYNCVKCTQVCPTGALEELTTGEKHTFCVGLASVDSEACIGCGLCARRCPRGAITMERQGDRRVARVDHQGCIGCGSCQYICPAQPVKAIKVNGLKR